MPFRATFHATFHANLTKLQTMSKEFESHIIGMENQRSSWSHRIDTYAFFPFFWHALFLHKISFGLVA